MRHVCCPPQVFLPAALLECQDRMQDFGAQALSNTLWALARLGCRPHSAWLDAAVGRSLQLLPGSSPQVTILRLGQGGLLWVLDKLGCMLQYRNQG